MDASIVKALDDEIEYKRAELERLRRELATLLEARRILSARIDITTNNHTAAQPPPKPKRSAEAALRHQRTIVDDIMRILDFADRAMTPVEVRRELAKLGREVPQPVVTSTLVRIYKANRIWRVGPAQYAAKRAGDAPLETANLLLTEPSGEPTRLLEPVVSDANPTEDNQ
jgi:hypothetical protein